MRLFVECSNTRDSYWNILLLALAWAFTLAASTLLTTIGPLSAKQLGESHSFASLTIGIFLLGAAVSSLPSSLLFFHCGRYYGFTIGCLCQFLGSIFGCVGIGFQCREMLYFGCFCIGLGQGLGQFYRFAVMEITPTELRSQAVTYVLAGGILAAFLGPSVASVVGYLLGQHEVFLGSYLAIACFALCSQFVLSCVDFSSGALHVDGKAEEEEEEELVAVKRSKKSFDTFSSSTAPVLPVEHTNKQSVSVVEIVSSRGFLVACGMGVVAQVVMTMAMATVSLTMSSSASSTSFTTSSIAFVMQAHFLAMFAPGLGAGALLERWGPLPVARLGGVLYLLSLGILALPDTTVVPTTLSYGCYWLGMVVLGVGWHMIFAASTVLLARLLTQTIPADSSDRDSAAVKESVRTRLQVQAANDVALFSLSGLGSVCAGLVCAWLGQYVIVYY